MITLGKDKIVKGLEEGIQKMSKGMKAKIMCSPAYGFGYDRKEHELAN